MRANFSVVLTALVLFNFQALAAPPPLWSGSSAGFKILWTSNNLVVRKNGSSRKLLDLAESAQAQWKQIAAQPGDGYYTQEFTFRLLSVVGPLLSIDEEDDCDCGGAHSSSFRRFHVVDLSHPDAAGPMPAPLSSWFSPEAIRLALLASSEVQQALGKNSTVPPTLPALIQRLEGATVNSGECSYSLDNHLLESYFFADYRNGAANVEMSLPFSAEVCRGEIKILKLNLPVPLRLRPWMESAAQRKQGFLAGSGAGLLAPAAAKTYLRFTNARSDR